ncbi:HNH endonuclease [Rhodococcus jostii]|uniref:HNH endonuclease n=1 Tax=Rhodococcus jostii TaxID=132919 RepID=UPI00362B81A9
MPGAARPIAGSEQKTRRVIAARSEGMCEYCGLWGYTIHHRVKQSQGGVWSPVNCIALCGHGTTGHHGWVEHHPNAAARVGLHVRPWQDPAEVMVRYRGRMAFLTDDGQVLFCTHNDRLDLTDPGYGNYTQCVDCDTQLTTDGGPL